MAKICNAVEVVDDGRGPGGRRIAEIRYAEIVVSDLGGARVGRRVEDGCTTTAVVDGRIAGRTGIGAARRAEKGSAAAAVGNVGAAGGAVVEESGLAEIVDDRRRPRGVAAEE